LTATIRFLEDPGKRELDRILALYAANAWWSGPLDRVLAARIVAGSHAFAVAEEDGSIIGMGRAISDRVSDAYIQDLTVDERHRGRGIGTRLVRALVQRLNDDGLFWIALIAEKNSHPFYEPLGFSVMPDAVPMLRQGR